jgi:hypothetical protein
MDTSFVTITHSKSILTAQLATGSLAVSVSQEVNDKTNFAFAVLTKDEAIKLGEFLIAVADQL